MSSPVFIPPFKQLVDGVAEYFAAHGVTSVVTRGWKARTEQINQGQGRANRVVFIGSKPDGSAGRLVNPRQPGLTELGADPATVPPTPAAYTWRPLCDWQRVIQVSVWAYDGANRNDEGAQDDALYQLLAWTIRAVNAVAFGNAVFGALQISVPRERGFGLEVLTELVFQHAMPDLPLEVGQPAPIVNRQP